MSAPRGFDWAALMRAGIGGLGLPPEVFWKLGPSEFLMLLGERGPVSMPRSAFEALAARFPDIETKKETRHDAAP